MAPAKRLIVFKNGIIESRPKTLSNKENKKLTTLVINENKIKKERTLPKLLYPKKNLTKYPKNSK